MLALFSSSSSGFGEKHFRGHPHRLPEILCLVFASAYVTITTVDFNSIFGNLRGNSIPLSHHPLAPSAPGLQSLIYFFFFQAV